MPVIFKRLDVRPLIAKGTEPFATIRARVASLKANEGLTVIAPFLPSPLIEKLGSEGFSSNVQHQADGSWAVNFWQDD